MYYQTHIEYLKRRRRYIDTFLKFEIEILIKSAINYNTRLTIIIND